MTSFERTAIFTIIQNIKQQLEGLQTLLAASGNEASSPSHTVIKKPVTSDPTSLYTSEEEDAELAQKFLMTRQLEMQAQEQFQKTWLEQIDNKIKEAEEISKKTEGN